MAVTDRLTTSYLQFLCADAKIILELLCIAEVLENQELSHVPQAPHFLEGAFDLRGEPTFVVNLADLLFPGQSQPSDPANPLPIVVLSEENRLTIGGEVYRVGLRIKAIHKVIERSVSGDMLLNSDGSIIEKATSSDENEIIHILNSTKVIAYLNQNWSGASLGPLLEDQPSQSRNSNHNNHKSDSKEFTSANNGHKNKKGLSRSWANSASQVLPLVASNLITISKQGLPSEQAEFLQNLAVRFREMNRLIEKGRDEGSISTAQIRTLLSNLEDDARQIDIKRAQPNTREK